MNALFDHKPGVCLYAQYTAVTSSSKGNKNIKQKKTLLEHYVIFIDVH
jgi:hypothetical protein